MTTVDVSAIRRPQWDVHPPAGWEPVAEVCRDLFDDLDAVTKRIVAAIIEEIPEYQPPASVMTAKDVYWSSSRNTAMFLRGMAENRGPAESEVAFRKLIGEISATRGFPLQPLTSSFHIAYRVLWSLLVERADRIGGRAPMMLLGGGSTIWEWMHATTTAVATGYNEEMARRESFATRTAAHFVESITQDPHTEESTALAAELGFRVEGEFRVFALSGNAPADASRMIVLAAGAAGGSAVAVQRGRSAAIVTQNFSSDDLDDMLLKLRPTPIGIGMSRSGLPGARASLLEADRALELASIRQGIVWFERDWLPSVALAHRASVELLLSPGIKVARTKPHLVEAVVAFASGGFSVADSARALRVSQNSVRYRLTRWRELTGWDPWSHDGLTRSLMGIEFAGLSAAHHPAD